MIGIAIDALALVILVKAFNEDDIGLGTAFLFSLVASIGTTILAIGLALLIGVTGFVIAAIVAAALVGVAVSALFGVEIKRSLAIGGLFMLVHMGVAVMFHVMLRS